jgi:hypothetical protein
MFNKLKFIGEHDTLHSRYMTGGVISIIGICMGKNIVLFGDIATK